MTHADHQIEIFLLLDCGRLIQTYLTLSAAQVAAEHLPWRHVSGRELRPLWRHQSSEARWFSELAGHVPAGRVVERVFI